MQADLEEETKLTFYRTVRSNIDSEAERENPDESNDLDENENEEIDENEHDEGDFTFACAVDDEASSIAEEIFHNGKIKPVFPLFDQSLVDRSSTADGISYNGKIKPVFPLFDQSLVDFPHQLPHVKNVFVGAAGQRGDEDEVVGPVCAWSKKTTDTATAPETCKKSNSTGFSKLWRFKEMSKRSSSDGKDTFVFLNKQAHEKSSQTSQAPDSVAVVKTEKTTATKTKSGGKGKTTSSAASAHEVYVKSKAASREEDRRRSYLPYKPELVGFFTNVNGGMSKNVHPF